MSAYHGRATVEDDDDWTDTNSPASFRDDGELVGPADFDDDDDRPRAYGADGGLGDLDAVGGGQLALYGGGLGGGYADDGYIPHDDYGFGRVSDGRASVLGCPRSDAGTVVDFDDGRSLDGWESPGGSVFTDPASTRRGSWHGDHSPNPYDPASFDDGDRSGMPDPFPLGHGAGSRSSTHGNPLGSSAGANSPGSASRQSISSIGGEGEMFPGLGPFGSTGPRPSSSWDQDPPSRSPLPMDDLDGGLPNLGGSRAGSDRFGADRGGYDAFDDGRGGYTRFDDDRPDPFLDSPRVRWGRNEFRDNDPFPNRDSMPAGGRGGGSRRRRRGPAYADSDDERDAAQDDLLRSLRSDFRGGGRDRSYGPGRDLDPDDGDFLGGRGGRDRRRSGRFDDHLGRDRFSPDYDGLGSRRRRSWDDSPKRRSSTPGRSFDRAFSPAAARAPPRKAASSRPYMPRRDPFEDDLADALRRSSLDSSDALSFFPETPRDAFGVGEPHPVAARRGLNRLADLTTRFRGMQSAFRSPDPASLIFSAFPASATQQTPASLATGAPANRAYQTHEQELLGLLEQADAVSTNGSADVRRARRTLVDAINGQINLLDGIRDRAWAAALQRAGFAKAQRRYTADLLGDSGRYPTPLPVIDVPLPPLGARRPALGIPRPASYAGAPRLPLPRMPAFPAGLSRPGLQGRSMTTPIRPLGVNTPRVTPLPYLARPPALGRPLGQTSGPSPGMLSSIDRLRQMSERRQAGEALANQAESAALRSDLVAQQQALEDQRQDAADQAAMSRAVQRDMDVRRAEERLMRAEQMLVEAQRLDQHIDEQGRLRMLADQEAARQEVFALRREREALQLQAEHRHIQRLRMQRRAHEVHARRFEKTRQMRQAYDDLLANIYAPRRFPLPLESMHRMAELRRDPFLHAPDLDFGYGRLDKLSTYGMTPQSMTALDAQALDDLYLFENQLRLDSTLREEERLRRWHERLRWEMLDQQERHLDWMRMSAANRQNIGLGSGGWWSSQFTGEPLSELLGYSRAIDPAVSLQPGGFRRGVSHYPLPQPLLDRYPVWPKAGMGVGRRLMRWLETPSDGHRRHSLRATPALSRSSSPAPSRGYSLGGRRSPGPRLAGLRSPGFGLSGLGPESLAALPPRSPGLGLRSGATTPLGARTPMPRSPGPGTIPMPVPPSPAPGKRFPRPPTPAATDRAKTPTPPQARFQMPSNERRGSASSGSDITTTDSTGSDPEADASAQRRRRVSINDVPQDLEQLRPKSPGGPRSALRTPNTKPVEAKSPSKSSSSGSSTTDQSSRTSQGPSTPSASPSSASSRSTAPAAASSVPPQAPQPQPGPNGPPPPPSYPASVSGPPPPTTPRRPGVAPRVSREAVTKALAGARKKDGKKPDVKV